ncbi:MAG: M48 family metalloprotease [candidate division WOR-3 bacterium]|nr:MAG: M48 family metalloprotease [candidate division WOR-3 bacterium]
MSGKFATFWDIEKQRTWRIYILFTFLALLYFASVFFIFSIIKLIFYLRQSLYMPNAKYHLFGADTVYLIIIAFVAAMLHWYYSNRNVVSKILGLLRAQPPDKNDRYHGIFNNVVDEIAAAAGGIMLERYIMPTGSMNAFALADLQGRNVVGVTEGLLSRATREELQAVVAHEVAHIVSNDCLETTITCSLFGMYSEAIAQLTKITSKREPSTSPLFEKESNKDAMTLGAISIPLFMLLFFIDLSSQILNMFISREKEYRADAAAVRLTRNPQSLASALYRIGTHWRGAGSVGEHIRPIFILNPQFSKLDEKEDAFATLFTTHPPLARRLQIILNLAHINLDTIAERMLRSNVRSTVPEHEKSDIRFMAQRDNKWQGPFTLMQLQTLEWLEPDTKIKISGHKEIVQANELPALSYFFQKRNEPIWKLRRICPTCREWLIPQSYEGLYLWRCAYCDGILAEHSKLPRIFVREEKSFTDRVRRIASLIKEESKLKHPRFNLLLNSINRRRCPKCGNPMAHKFYSYAYHVEIDECKECKVTWFDADEIETLQCLIEMEEDQ